MWLRNAIRLLAVIAAAAGLHFLFFAPYRANLEIGDIDQRTARAQSLDRVDAAPVARANLHDLLAIQRARRLDPVWYVLYGANCEILGRPGDAADAYSGALRVDQRPEIYFDRGMVMLQLGRIDAAVSDLATAVRFKPDLIFQFDGDLRARVSAAAGMH